jgi:hypothetical protein
MDTTSSQRLRSTTNVTMLIPFGGGRSMRCSAVFGASLIESVTTKRTLVGPGVLAAGSSGKLDNTPPGGAGRGDTESPLMFTGGFGFSAWSLMTRTRRRRKNAKYLSPRPCTEICALT